MSSDSQTDAWWIDCDPGTDDALAISLMIAHKLNIVGISVSLGNGTVDLCLKNTAKILGVLEHKVPVYRGSSNPMASHKFEGTDGYFGEDSLGDSPTFKDFEGYTDCLKEESAYFALINASKEAKKNNQKFKILALAPVTTLGIAVAIDKTLPDRVDALIIMAGSLDGMGFTKLSTEFNFDRDPEAAHRVLRDYNNVTVVTIETAPGGLFTTEETVALRYGKTNFSLFFKEITARLLVDGDESKALIAPLFDAISACVCIDESCITESFEAYASVDVEGALTNGSMVLEWPQYNKDFDKIRDPNATRKLVRLIKSISREKYMELVNYAFTCFK